MISGAASLEITGGRCSPFATHWTDDTYSLARGTAAALLQQDLKSWYFLTADYERIATVPADTAFRSADTAGCAVPGVR